MNRRAWTGSSVLLATLVGAGASLVAWKRDAIASAEAANARQPEPVEVVTIAVATSRTWTPTTTSVGTVRALQSVTLRNELPGSVARLDLAPGRIVEPGELLVALDVSVEEAELAAAEARLALAEAVLGRTERVARNRAASEQELDRARAERDVARAEVARTRATIARKTIRAPFRARVGLSDVHPGQYLATGSELTTLQGVDEAVHVDFAIPQDVARRLAEGDAVEVALDGGRAPAAIVAIDARVDATTRNARVRARLEGAAAALAPGASVRVHVPAGASREAPAVPVSALRKGPDGDHVFVIVPDDRGQPRARLRPVRSGAVLGDEVLVLEGLTAGEQVAAAGSFKLREAALVAFPTTPATE